MSGIFFTLTLRKNYLIRAIIDYESNTWSSW